MQKELVLPVSPKQASDKAYYLPLVANKLKVAPSQITHLKVLGRSIDARHKNVRINLRLLVFIDEEPKNIEALNPPYQQVQAATPVIIVGAGPAGLFAALKLLELGLKPIVIERGKDVRKRKLDIAQIHRNNTLPENSNYSFGEGGAGTYSDGKLYTRSKKRGNIKEVLAILQQNGADQDILIDSHPHIGSDKLPGIIENIRETIKSYGGEVHFDTQCTDLLIKNDAVTGIQTASGDKLEAPAVILATGHSARDIYDMLDRQNIQLEAKAFAMGVRIEHPQTLIDSIQYSCDLRGPYLPAATYSLVQQIEGRGVYSFCMCPGGVVVPASTATNEMVVNGMSPSNRNTKFANSGMVVEIRIEDIASGNTSALTGLNYQRNYEALAFQHGGDGQIAPAQRMLDFVQGRLSTDLPESSYRPGTISSPMHEWIPEHIRKRLQAGFLAFDKKMKGYLTNEAQLIGVESRTSSPVRILRDKETLQHPQVKGLFPCGEGAGYAGGIVSSAIDGQLSAQKVCEMLQVK